ncbi:unnamed protein product [Eruca vesicaria subsp. sativa]|uniref:Uncharacterized protein n=1 Tax=Eruca vesicaria subsp. sativa TaxID=29727 RepID=A0ABC8L238_ERUVS|nr:unnamed protein product [Eruca vesicaria subsp. sativa]
MQTPTQNKSWEARNINKKGQLMSFEMLLIDEHRGKTWQEELILLDIKGCVIIWRDCHGDVFAAQAELFFSKLIEKEGDTQPNGVTYMFVQLNITLFLGGRGRIPHVYFVIAYGLLDETTDFRYPQYMGARILNEFIKTDAYEWKLHRCLLWLSQVLSWKREGIEYKKNEGQRRKQAEM